MARRECVTREALERAIKAQVALRHGIDSEALTVPFTVREMADQPAGRGWAVDLSHVPSPHHSPLQSAVDDVASRLGLCGPDSPRDARSRPN